MKSRIFKSKFSDMKVEVYKSGYITIIDNENKSITIGRPPNARFDLILKAIEYVKQNENK